MSSDNASVLDKVHEYHVPSELPLAVRGYKMAELALRTLREEKLELGPDRDHASMEQGFFLAKQAAQEIQQALLAKQEEDANRDYLDEQVKAGIDVLHQISTLSMDRRMAFRLKETVENFEHEAHCEEPGHGMHLKHFPSIAIGKQAHDQKQ